MTVADAPHDWDAPTQARRRPGTSADHSRPFVRLAEAGALTGALLDAGCGTGEHTILAARSGARPWRRHSSRAIEIARRKAAGAASTPTSRCSTHSTLTC